MVSVQSFLLFLLLLVVLLGLLNALIRWSLRAPRVAARASPADLGLAFSRERIPTANGRSLAAWLIPRPSSGVEAGPALVLLHGWGGNAATLLPLVLPLHLAGYTLLCVDARNHGDSDGDTFSSLPRFAEDMEAALTWLHTQPDVAVGRVGLVGHSVGAAAALLVASRQPGVGAVVSLSAFAHPATMMRRWLAEKQVPYWPLGWYILHYVEHVIGQRYADIAPCHTIARIGQPVLLVHGCDDPVVPLADAREIHRARRHDRVELLVLEGAHDQFEAVDLHLPTLVRFLDAALKS